MDFLQASKPEGVNEPKKKPKTTKPLKTLICEQGSSVMVICCQTVVNFPRSELPLHSRSMNTIYSSYLGASVQSEDKIEGKI